MPNQHLHISDSVLRNKLDTLNANWKEKGAGLYDINHKNKGISHIIGSGLGCGQSGITTVSGDGPYIN